MRRGEIHRYLDLPLTRIGAHDLVGVAQGDVCIDRAKVETHLAGGDAGNIEHVIDQLHLKRDTFRNDIDIRAHMQRQRGVIG